MVLQNAQVMITQISDVERDVVGMIRLRTQHARACWMLDIPHDDSGPIGTREAGVQSQRERSEDARLMASNAE